MESYITPEYLLEHGFRRLVNGEVYERVGFPYFDKEEDLVFVEIKGGRQAFVVILRPFNEDQDSPENRNETGFFESVHVQEDAGCGYVEIPFPWSCLSVEYFESVFYGIRGKRP